MHRLTKLKIDELRAKYKKEYEEEKGRAIAELARRGVLHSSAGESAVLKCGYSYIEKILETIFSAERRALSHERSPLPDDYFEELKGEIRAIANSLYEEIISKAGEYFKKESSFTNALQKHRVETERSIDTRVSILQEEIRLGIEPISRTTISISGDVGALNTGVVYGNVHGQVQKIKDSTVESAFNNLLEEINRSDIDKETKVQQMEYLRFLVEQYQISPKDRNFTIINMIMNVLSTAANLLVAWGQHGPVIIEALK